MAKKRSRKGRQIKVRVYSEKYGIGGELDITEWVEGMIEDFMRERNRERKKAMVKGNEEDIPVIDLRNLGRVNNKKKKSRDERDED